MLECWSSDGDLLPDNSHMVCTLYLPSQAITKDRAVADLEILRGSFSLTKIPAQIELKTSLSWSISNLW